MDKKIKLLVTFIQAHVGGAMTSLVNFLNALDTDKYDVDVLFYEIDDSRHGIKEEINILPQGRVHNKYDISNILEKGLNPAYVCAKVREIYLKKVKKDKKKAVQLMAKYGSKYSPKLDKEYDIVVAYEFDWPLHYAANNVKAKKKISWHHLDFHGAGLVFKVDKSSFDKMDAMVFVSEDCRQKFVKLHPQYADKSVFIPNLLSAEYVRARGNEQVSLPFEEKDGLLKMVTVARVDFKHKGLDRGVRIIKRLKDEGLADNIRWVIIGEGRQEEELKQLIVENGLEENIFCIGLKKNPIPYLKKFDFMFMPSHYEGKPMAVTEAQICGLVPVVARYTSATEQIKNNVDGLIFDNDDDALYEGIKSIVKNPEILKGIKENIDKTDFGNEKEIKRFDELADKLLGR